MNRILNDLIKGTPFGMKERITELKNKLSQTDYQAIKYAEGALTEEEFSETKQKRASWRAEINALEEELCIMK